LGTPLDDHDPVVGDGGENAEGGDGEVGGAVLLRLAPLVLACVEWFWGYPKNSSKFSTAVKSNSFSTILGPPVLALRGLDDWREGFQEFVP